MSEIKAIYAFFPLKKQACRSCINQIMKWNMPNSIGYMVKCVDCDNEFRMELLKRPVVDEMSIAYGLTKSEEEKDFRLIPEKIELNSDIYNKDSFSGVAKSLGIGGNWAYSGDMETEEFPVSVYKNADIRNPLGERYYAPLRAGILHLRKQDIK